MSRIWACLKQEEIRITYCRNSFSAASTVLGFKDSALAVSGDEQQGHD
jgi:hypothetical protein